MTILRAIPVLLLTQVLVLKAASAAPMAYTDQAAFLADLENISSVIAHEGFESDAIWGDVRSSVSEGFMTVPAKSQFGVTWTSNNLSSEVTTSDGAAREGQWGFFSLPHGSYTNPDPGTDCDIPGDCGDGFKVAADSGVLYGIGGWVDTNTPFAKVGLYIGSYNGDVEGGVIDQTVGTQPVFFGVIDPDGFTQVEYRELEGKTEGSFEGDLKNIFADDFYFAGSQVVVPEPATATILALSVLLVLRCRD